MLLRSRHLKSQIGFICNFIIAGSEPPLFYRFHSDETGMAGKCDRQFTQFYRGRFNISRRTVADLRKSRLCAFTIQVDGEQVEVSQELIAGWLITLPQNSDWWYIPNLSLRNLKSINKSKMQYQALSIVIRWSGIKPKFPKGFDYSGGRRGEKANGNLAIEEKNLMWYVRRIRLNGGEETPRNT